MFNVNLVPCSNIHIGRPGNTGTATQDTIMGICNRSMHSHINAQCELNGVLIRVMPAGVHSTCR